MHHYFEAITNTSGDSLVGYFGRVINRANNNTVTLASDDNGTPIVVVSGVDNMAKTDDFGNLDFYVEPGTYDLEIYAPNATSLIMRVPNVAMNSSKGDRGDLGPEGPQGEGLEEVMAPTGAALVGYGNRSVGDKLNDIVTVQDAGSFGSAFGGLASNRLSPPGFANYGIGTVRIGKRAVPPISFASSQLGLKIEGEANVASAVVLSSANDVGISLGGGFGYGGVTISNVAVTNPNAPGNTVGVKLDGLNGGGYLHLDQMQILGCQTAIKHVGNVNADKAILTNVGWGGGVYGYDGGTNTQAISYLFIGCAGGGKEADGTDHHFRLGGSGSLSLLGGAFNVYESMFKLVEGGGNVFNSSIHTDNVKLEYHGAGNMFFIDGRDNLLARNVGGTIYDMRHTMMVWTQGDTTPSPATNIVIQMGAGGVGAPDTLRCIFDGGYLDGIVQLNSNSFSSDCGWLQFRDMRKAPSSSTLSFNGTGDRLLVTYRGCVGEADHARGGDAFVGSLPLARHITPIHAQRHILNTGDPAAQNTGGFYGDRVGGQFDISVPAGCIVEAVWLIVRDNGGSFGGSDLTFETWPSAAERTANTPGNRMIATTISNAALLASSHMVSVPLISGPFLVGPEGKLFTRLTANAANRVLKGQLMLQITPLVP